MRPKGSFSSFHPQSKGPASPPCWSLTTTSPRSVITSDAYTALVRRGRPPEAHSPLTPSDLPCAPCQLGTGRWGPPCTVCLLLNLEAAASGSRHSFILALGREAGR